MSRHETALGVALTKCYFCGGDNSILLNKILVPEMKGKVESCHGKIVDMTPCPSCEKMMKMGVILITFDPEKSEPGWNRPSPHATEEERRRFMPNPYRTGGFFVVRDEFIQRVFQPDEIAGWALKNRWMFIEHEAAVRMNLFGSKGTHDPETLQEIQEDGSQEASRR